MTAEQERLLREVHAMLERVTTALEMLRRNPLIARYLGGPRDGR